MCTPGKGSTDTWSVAGASGLCTSCGGGEVTNGDKTQCTPCPAGEFENGSNACEPCGTDMQYKQGENADTECAPKKTSCPAGAYFTESANSTADHKHSGE